MGVAIESRIRLKSLYLYITIAIAWFIMKRFIFFSCLVLLLSCSERQASRTILKQAEESMTAEPDRSLVLVQGVDGSSLPTKGLRARHALLLTMAQDKCFIDVSNDSTIRMAYDYFRKHGSLRDRLLSTYYLGVIKQNAGEYIDAALSFREAEPLAEELEDYRQLSLINQHLSHIFSLNYDHIRALEYAEAALLAAEKGEEYLMADYCRLDLAKQLLSKGDYSKAEGILRGLIAARSDMKDLFFSASLTLARVLIYKPNPEMKEAHDLLLKIQDLKSAEALSRNLMYMTKLAVVLEQEGDTQFSNELLNQSSLLLKSPIDSVVYYNSQSGILANRKEWKKAFNSLSAAYKTQDRVITGLLGQSLTHSMESFYADKLEIEHVRSHSRLYLLGFISSILLAIIIALFFILEKKNKVLLDDIAKIQEVSDDLQQLRAKNATSYKLFERFISDKVKSLQQLSESYFSWDESAIKKREKNYGKLMKEEVIYSFRKQLGELRGDQSLIPALEQSLNLSEDGLMEKARLLLKNDKELDYSILILLFSGFSIKSISYLFRMSEASLRMRKTRFKQQFESLSEPARGVFLKKLG